MLWAGLLLGLSCVVLGEQSASTLTTEAQADGPAALEDSLPKQRCVPTAVTRGACHVCVCGERGVYRCRSDECAFHERNATVPSHPECEPHMLYNEGALWCTCSPVGFWRSVNCRVNFRSVHHKQVAKQNLILPHPKKCENGSLYVVDCNICECRGSVLSTSACTNRTCARGSKADQCKLGQLLRLDTQICACSESGLFVDKHCITLPSNDTVQKLASTDIASLTATEGGLPSPREKCVPHTVIQRDCNRCTCTATGQLICTSLLCLSNASGKNFSAEVDSMLRSRRPTRVASLPELPSDRAPCEPGKQYRYRCNTCFCTKQGLPACTTMICLEYFGSKKDAQRAKGNKKSIYQLPEIHDGDNCTRGKTYRLDCNACLCTAHNRLVCTKKLCLSAAETNKQLEFEHMKNTIKEISPPKKDMYMESLDDTVVIHKRTHTDDKQNDADTPINPKSNKKNRKGQKHSIRTQSNKETNRHDTNITKNIQKEAKTAARSGAFESLPKTKCNPGQIYMKGCQRCFCNHKKIAQCTNRPCDEMRGPVQVPKDVYPRITPKEIEKLPVLPHEAARCKPGKVYTVQCNVCLCLANGNLLCNTLLCLAVHEVNKLAALEKTGKPCKHIKRASSKENKIDPELDADCIDCSCVQGKLECSAMEACVPFRFRRALHGELNPRAKPKPSLDTAKGAKCLPGMVYKQSCNNCYCQGDGSLRCTRKGCLNYQQVQKLKQQRQRLLKLGL